MGKLTATAVRHAKPSDTAYKMPDGGGMYLLIAKSGSKYWRYDYRHLGKRKTLALGVYPDTSLADARKLHQSARESLAQGTDPNDAKRLRRLTKKLAAAESFEALAHEWFKTKMQDKSEKHRYRVKRAMENDLFPSLGRRPINQINAPELLMVLRKIEGRGAIETAHRGGP